METEWARKVHERENLRNIIAQWNANRLDLFELSEPNEELEFHGVMRFYFQDAGQKVATKCIRVASTATAQTVIEILIEKFRPDMRMLSIPEYALYEIHESGDERKLGEDEKPLLVQLNWHKDDREGRFLLRRMDEKTFVTHQSLDDGSHFKRKLSKREKKEKKKKEKMQRANKVIEEENGEDRDGIAEKLYTEMPETSFTRSISNPEAVMRRRRQQKLEKKLQQFRSKDGGPDTGGTLKIYGESLCKDVPYKTLLLSVRDTAAYVVKEMLDKYGMYPEDPSNYCLVQVLVGGGDGKEFILDDDECPLAILMNHHPSRGSPIFHIQKRPVDFQPRKRKKKTKSSSSSSSKGDADGFAQLGDYVEPPFFLELNPDGSDVTSFAPKRYALAPNVTEVGCERGASAGGAQHLQLFGPNVYPRHCVVANTDGIVTVTPCNRDADTFVNGQRVHETTILQSGAAVRFGKIHCFRFVDPAALDERQRHDSVGRHQGAGDASYDRHSMKDDVASLHQSFDHDGQLAETVSTTSKEEGGAGRRPSRSLDVAARSDSFDLPPQQQQQQRRGHDPILPAILELWDDGEDAFLASAIAVLDTAAVQFKLAPTYALYMAARFRASTHYRPEIAPTERAHRLAATMAKVAAGMQLVVQERCLEAGSLAFWMANSSELLHFLKQDRHLGPFCLDCQDVLAECVQLAFRSLVHCMQNELLNSMPAFLEDRDDMGEEEGATGEILVVLSSAMALLRRCRVNAALTIQLFSQLFHFVNMWLFNRVVCGGGDPKSAAYCTRLWGVRLKCRLARVEMWAEKQGLELAADCHLSRILQAADLLQAPKSTSEDLAAISSACFKLNSLQLRSLLERYQLAHDEPDIPRALVENVVKVAENTADEMARSDGRDVRLEEDADLQLPFLLPEDGYSCDIVRGVPAGLQEFVSPFQRAGLCRLTIQPSSSGLWTIYMNAPDHDSSRVVVLPGSAGTGGTGAQGYADAREARVPEPEVATIKLQKSNNGMGLSIVAARGVGQDKLGIYVKSVVKGGAADADGRLQAGDQLLKVDGQSLVGISQERAAEYMTRTGPVVVLEVAKQGAMYHGLATLLSQPSPVVHRGGPSQPGGRRLSERDIHSKVLREQNQDLGREAGGGGPLQPPSVLPRMQSSKSVPSLNSGAGGSSQQETFWVPVVNGSGPGRLQQQPHEVYNPAYSRTSSTTSIVRAGPPPPEMSQQTPRARSTNNLRQDAYPAPGVSSFQQQLQGPMQPRQYNGDLQQQLRNRPMSQPSFHQDEERHYQNIVVYQQQQQQQQQQNHLATSQSQLPKTLPFVGGAEERMSQRMLRGSQGSLYRPPEPQHQQRPLSALVTQWPGGDHRHQDSSSPPQLLQDPQASNRNFWQQQQQQAVPVPPRPTTSHKSQDFQDDEDLGRVANLRIGGDGGGAGAGGTMWRSERDLLRQEAKMEEMREEIRRREERLARERKIQELQQRCPPQQQQPQAPYSDRNLFLRGPPPTTPKPRLPAATGQAISPPQQQHIRTSQFVGSHEVPPERPPPPAEELLLGHRDSPQPPPPPPSSTHPLYQQQQPAASSSAMRATGYRHGPGGLPLSRSTEHFDRLPAHDGRFDAQTMSRGGPGGDHGFINQSEGSLMSALSPSPWDREEKEKERKRRLDEARRMRDQEIDELENHPRRSAKQEERLRTLRLEKEFQRRAEELKNNDDDEENEEDDDVMDRRGFLRLVQEDLERARQKRLERESVQQQQQQHQDDVRRQMQQQMAAEQARPAAWKKDVQQPPPSSRPALTAATSPTNRSEEWLRRQQEIKEQRRELQQHQHQEEQQQLLLRQQKLDEANRKREQKKEQERLAIRELQNAREAEERILREAQKRQEEDLRRERAMQQQQQQQLYHHQKNASILSTTNYVHHHHQPPLDNGHPGPAVPGSQRLDTLLMSPHYHNQQYMPHHQTNGVVPPPAMQQQPQQLPPDHNSNGPQWTSDATPTLPREAPVKRVSFHDPKVEEQRMVSFDGQQMVVDDDDDGGGHHHHHHHHQQQLLLTPTNPLQTFTVHGGTPGVIGAQEVYRDPRQQRIEASARNLPQALKGPGPEQLSFREKMKKFALETGENNTPRDKVKISKAQRDIETNLSAPPPAAAAIIRS